MTPSALERRVVWLAALVSCLGVAWAIWSVPLVISNDGPQAVLTAHIEAHYDDPGSIFARQFAVGFGLSGRGFSVLYRPLAAVLAWPNALRASQLVIVLALAFAVGCLSKAVSGNTRVAALLGFAIAFSWTFYMGFLAFSISMAVGLMVLAFVVSRTEGLSLLQKAAVSTALVLQLFMHGFAVFITLALVGLVVATRLWMRRKGAPPAEWRRDVLREGAWLGMSALPSVAVLLVMRTAQSDLVTYTGGGKTTWASPSEWVRVLPRLAVPGSTALGIVVFLLAFVSIARAVLRLRREGESRRPEEVALVIGAVGLLLAALLMPLHVPGWQFFAPRFLTTGLALSLCLFACEKLEQSRTRLVVDAGVLVLVGSVILGARALHHRQATACEDALIGLDHRIPRTGFQLPIVFDSNCGRTEDDAHLDVPYARALVHFHALFAVTHGGSVPYGFFGPAAVHAFVPRGFVVPAPPLEEYWALSNDDERFKHPEPRAELLTNLAVFGMHYENILLFGANANDRTVLLDRGYAIDFQHGSFVNAHFTPCTVELVSEVLPNDPPVMVRAGLRQDDLWLAKIAPIAGRHAIKASLDVLCGNDVWVRVQWQQSPLRCTNADAQGRIAIHTDHAQTTQVVCER